MKFWIVEILFDHEAPYSLTRVVTGNLTHKFETLALI
jgi:hypothetical protein